MKKILVVVDMQKDFVDGALGTKEACAIVDNVVKKITDFDGKIFVTYDTHGEDYMNTREGKNLPVPHCIKGTEGWMLDKKVEAALAGKDVTKVEKVTFGSVDLPEFIKEYAAGEEFEVCMIGLCTDICVVSNALIVKATFPETDICVDANCCAGVTPQAHEAALMTMQSCQIKIAR
jgi:nicotinamidase-related amidase